MILQSPGCLYVTSRQRLDSWHLNEHELQPLVTLTALKAAVKPFGSCPAEHVNAVFTRDYAAGTLDQNISFPNYFL